MAFAQFTISFSKDMGHTNSYKFNLMAKTNRTTCSVSPLQLDFRKLASFFKVALVVRFLFSSFFENGMI